MVTLSLRLNGLGTSSAKDLPAKDINTQAKKRVLQNGFFIKCCIWINLIIPYKNY
jgi:hypothetical protein